ncbi:putative lipid II flippase FtsW [candidate division GN15 bacterium]|nr:putative lipid II flippase FtsW [candidate division GN15 bacterium]
MKRSRSKKPIDEKLLAAFGVLIVIGLVMVYSTSSIIAESRFGSHMFFFKQQLIWALLSVAVVFVLARIDLQRYAIYSAPALLLTLVLLALVFTMPARNGSQRWIMLFGFSMQPSELFRFLMVIYLAFSLSNPRRNITRLKDIVFPYVPIIGLGLLLIMFEPDLGSVIVITMTAVGMFFFAGARIKYLAAVAVPAAGLASFMVLVLGYKKARIMDYLASVADPLQGSYQVRQAALTLGNGGILGNGLGNGSQKLFFLPYPHTDFIFAATGEEIGMLGLLFLLACFAFILFRGFKIAGSQPDKFGYLLAAGMTWALFINIAINIGVVTALLPVTGLPLPFMSYGGSSLVVSCAAIGVLLNLSRRRVAR